MKQKRTGLEMDFTTEPSYDIMENGKCWSKSNSTSSGYHIQDNDGSYLLSNIESIIGGVVITVESFGGAILNFLVIVALLRSRQLRKEYITPFIISNAMTDLVFSTITLPTLSIRFFMMKWPSISCSWHSFIGLGTWICSAWNLLGVAIIRCVFIYNNRLSKSRYSKYAAVLLPMIAWILSFCILAPTFLGFNGRFGLLCNLQECILINVDSKGNTLSFEPLQAIAGHAIVIGIILLGLNSATYIMVARQSRNLAQKMNQTNEEASKRILEKEKKVGTMMAIVCIVFFLVFMLDPIVRMIDFDHLRTNSSGYVLSLCIKASIVIVNPIIYISCHEQYREEMKNLAMQWKSVMSKILQ